MPLFVLQVPRSMLLVQLPFILLRKVLAAAANSSNRRPSFFLPWLLLISVVSVNASSSIALDLGGLVAQTDKIGTYSKVADQLNDEKSVCQRGSRFMHYEEYAKAPPKLISNSSIWKLYERARVSDAGVSATSAQPTMAVKSSGNQIIQRNPYYMYSDNDGNTWCVDGRNGNSSTMYLKCASSSSFTSAQPISLESAWGVKANGADELQTAPAAVCHITQQLCTHSYLVESHTDIATSAQHVAVYIFISSVRKQLHHHGWFLRWHLPLVAFL